MSKDTSARMITAFGGECKTIMEWLDDKRCHPEVTYDVLRRRLGRSSGLAIPEIALTTPVCKGSQVGDNKQRVKDRKLKERERYKMFVLCQNVRHKHSIGQDKKDIKERYDITESMYNKIVARQYGYNWAWGDLSPGRVPDHFKEIKESLEFVPGAKDGLEKYQEAD